MPRPNATDTFNKAFSQGVDIGASNWQLQEKERINLEAEERKRKENARIKREQHDALLEAMGVNSNDPSQVDPITKQPKRTGGVVDPRTITEQGNENVITGNMIGGQMEPSSPPVQEQQQGFKRPNPLQEALLMEQMSPEGRQVYKDFVKREDPAISDTYFGVKSIYDKETGSGALYGYNRQTGKREKIADDPYYQIKPKVGGSYIVYGNVKVNGETVGIKGRRTRVVEMEDGSFQYQDLGRIPSGSKNSEDEKTALEFEISMSGYQKEADQLAQRKNTYLNKDFSKLGGESAREDYRIGYNSAMTNLALRTLKLGSPEAEARAIEIWNRGKKMITDTGSAGAMNDAVMTREKFSSIMKQVIIDEYLDGKDYRYAQPILKFLEFKYDNYLPKQDSKFDDDFFGDIQLDEEGNVIE